ncbi:MAG: anthranilate phosphoribosyltransferase [Myxococcota bacterium]|nr:anthranilate phosphoribosyltransferase [Myxococcota bacterium]
MTIQAVVKELVAGRSLAEGALESAFGEIMDGEATAAQSAALLVALRMRGESSADLVAAAKALRARAQRAEAGVPGAIDTCGTGGSGLSTFNISTTAAFVVAGAGVPVAKHGNRAASSRSGSFDVFEALGVCIDLPIAQGAALLAEVGIAPLFARTAHPAMRHLAPVRSELGIRTLMNGLGPLLNPLGVRCQVVGVYSADLLQPVAEALRALGTESALVVHGRDGLDELTVTAPSDAVRLQEGELTRLVVDPSEQGVASASLADLEGGDASTNAVLLREILEGKQGPRRDVVLLNAGAALWIAGKCADLGEGVVAAGRSIDSGAARDRLEALVAASNRRFGEQGS